MKIGDILYCKNYFFYNCHFYIGDEFEIIDMNDEHTLLRTKLNAKILMNNIKYKQYRFNNRIYIWDYLQTNIEFRKYKLEKLNEISVHK
jgi:hypothetical protein